MSDTTSRPMRRWIRATIWGVILLPVLYVSVYVVLSSLGQYRPMGLVGVGHGQLYWAWAPLGFYDHSLPPDSLDGRGWRGPLPQLFLPLWIADMSYMHKNKDWIISWHTVDGHTIYATNSISLPKAMR